MVSSLSVRLDSLGYGYKVVQAKAHEHAHWVQLSIMKIS